MSKLSNSRFVLILAAAFLFFQPSASNAALILELERISDTVGILTGSGTSDEINSNLNFDTPNMIAGTGPGEVVTLTKGAITIGASQVTDFSILVLGESSLIFDSNFFVGDVWAGSTTITLVNRVWAPVGTTGLFQGGTGLWTITGDTVSIPSSGVLSLFALGVAGLGIARHRKAA